MRIADRIATSPPQTSSNKTKKKTAIWKVAVSAIIHGCFLSRKLLASLWRNLLFSANIYSLIQYGMIFLPENCILQFAIICYNVEDGSNKLLKERGGYMEVYCLHI